MSANSSSNSSINPPTVDCYKKSMFMLAAYCSTLILLLPLFVLVLYMGFQRQRKSLTSHSDVFTFHMVTLELIRMLGTCFFWYGTYTGQTLIITVGESIFSMIKPGETLFHLLTCGERYLAVVHPVTYLGLRHAGGVRIRNICIVCVWLLCFGSAGLAWLEDFYRNSFYVFFVVSLIFVPFFSVSVLRVLNRPGPGEVGGNRNRIDQSKQRAFYTVVAIMGALMVRFFSTLLIHVQLFLSELSDCDKLFIIWSVVWFSLPSSLVLPLLFLHRAGKLPGCARNTESV